MIDGKKILNLSVNIDELLLNKDLDFTGKYNRNTGEGYEYPLFKKYNGIEFLIRDNSKEIEKIKDDNKKEIIKKPVPKYIRYVKLEGSIHKYFNQGLHNYNDFFYTNLLSAIIDLCKKFNINPCITILNNVEFGVNIIVPFNIKDFLNSIISHKGKQFVPFKDTDGASGIQCLHTDYIIKIYHKSLQYEQPENILRFEIKAIRMKYFEDKKINIKYLSDLLNPDLFFQLGAVLKAVFNEILFYDWSINETNLNAKELLILSNGRNKMFWEQLKPDSEKFAAGSKGREYQNERRNYYTQLDSYKEVLNKYSTSTIQKDVLELIEKKYKELANYNESLKDKLTDFLNSFENEKRDKLTDFETDLKNTEKGQITISDIVRICPVTGLAISMQKPESKFLCNTGINYYYHNEKEIYYQLSERLSPKWRNEPLETQFREIAHSVRNEHFNIKNNTKKSIFKVNENSLFDNLPFILPEKLIQAGLRV